MKSAKTKGLKSVRKKKSPLTLAKEKADRALQEWGRRTFKKCEACGGKYNCLHHFYTKGSSNACRYYEPNLIPICVSCHYRHHQHDNAEVHGEIIRKRGLKWYTDLTKYKNQTTIKANLQWYEDNRLRYENNEI